MNGPNPLEKHPMAGFPQVCFIRNTISNPNIEIVNSGTNKVLSPPVTGAFKCELRLRPPTVDAKKPATSAAPAAGAAK